MQLSSLPPYAPPASAIDEQFQPQIRSKWVLIFGVLFSTPFAAIGLIGLAQEWINRSATAKQDAVFGVMLASSFLISTIGIFATVRFAVYSITLQRSRVFSRLAIYSGTSAIPYAAATLSSKFDPSELSQGLAAFIFTNTFVFLSLGSLAALILFIYFLLPFYLTRWRVRKQNQFGIAPAPNQTFHQTFNRTQP